MRSFLFACVAWSCVIATAVHGQTAVSLDACCAIGEHLTYGVYWGVIPVGEAEFWSEWVETPEGRRLIAFKGRARSNGVVAKIFPVDDYIESLVDPQTFLPVTYVQLLREGRHRRDDFVVFRHDRGEATWYSARKDKTETIPIRADTRDVLSLIYYMRSRGMEANKEHTFQVVVDNRTYDLLVRAMEEEVVKLPEIGKVPCLKMEPQAGFGQVFSNKGRVLAWFARDNPRFCAKMVGILPVANVKVQLRRIARMETGGTSTLGLQAARLDATGGAPTGIVPGTPGSPTPAVN